MKIKAKDSFKEIRIKQGFSLTALADEMNVSTSVVFNIESHKNVRPATARKACAALNEAFETLFTIEN